MKVVEMLCLQVGNLVRICDDAWAELFTIPPRLLDLSPIFGSSGVTVCFEGKLWQLKPESRSEQWLRQFHGINRQDSNTHHKPNLCAACKSNVSLSVACLWISSARYCSFTISFPHNDNRPLFILFKHSCFKNKTVKWSFINVALRLDRSCIEELIIWSRDRTYNTDYNSTAICQDRLSWDRVRSTRSAFSAGRSLR